MTLNWTELIHSDNIGTWAENLANLLITLSCIYLSWADIFNHFWSRKLRGAPRAPQSIGGESRNKGRSIHET